MTWMGNMIRDVATSKGVSLKKLAEAIGVSRQAVNAWINGKIPKGNHLVALCQQLDIEPNYLFSSELNHAITVPLHRKRGRAKITSEVNDEALGIAEQYNILFKQSPSPGVVPILRIDQRNEKVAKAVAGKLRDLSEIERGNPIDYPHTFALLEQLGIVAVFRSFPKTIKSYAFHAKIHGHRVIFVNIETKLIDLIFPLLHDAVHCIRDEKITNGEYDEAEENFCDQVANFVQFPDEYVSAIYTAISDLRPGVQINKLKEFSRRNSHSLIGIDKAMTALYPEYKLDVARANTNLKKEFQTIGEIVFGKKDPREYVRIMKNFSPKFIRLLVEQMPNISDRKLADYLGFDSGLDARSVKAELLRLQ